MTEHKGLPSLLTSRLIGAELSYTLEGAYLIDLAEEFHRSHIYGGQYGSVRSEPHGGRRSPRRRGGNGFVMLIHSHRHPARPPPVVLAILNIAVPPVRHEFERRADLRPAVAIV